MTSSLTKKKKKKKYSYNYSFVHPTFTYKIILLYNYTTPKTVYITNPIAPLSFINVSRERRHIVAGSKVGSMTGGK